MTNLLIPFRKIYGVILLSRGKTYFFIQEQIRQVRKMQEIQVNIKSAYTIHFKRHFVGYIHLLELLRDKNCHSLFFIWLSVL